jgi:hypothetical protein
MHQNDLILEHLKAFSDYPPEVQSQIDLMIKLIYFEDPEFYPVEIKDLVESEN